MQITRTQLAAALPFAHKEKTRYAMNAVRVFSTGNACTVEATNGKQLIRVTDASLDSDARDADSLTVPAELAKQSLRGFPRGKRSQHIEVSRVGEVISTESSGQSLTYRETLGVFPPTDDVWPESPEGLVIGLGVPVLEVLIKALKAAKLDVVKLTIKDAEAGVHFVSSGGDVKLEGILMPVQIA